MKITYLLPAVGHTGGFSVLYRFMDELSRRGHDVYAVTPSMSLKWSHGDADRIHRTAVLGSAGAKIRSRLKRAIKSIPGLHGAMRFLTRARQPSGGGLDCYAITQGLLKHHVPADVTVASSWATALAAYATLDRSAVAYHMQHYEELFYADEVHRLSARQTYLLPLSLIANSSWLRDQIAVRFGRSSELVTPGIDVEVFHPKRSIKEKYAQMKPTTVATYYSARLFKGWLDGVAAMRMVFERVEAGSIQWVVFGDMPPSSAGVQFTSVGRLHGGALAELYSGAHMLLMPSWYESFPLPPIEAMACGCVPVVTRWGTEDYAEDGRNSFVLHPRSPAAMAEAIVSAMRNPERTCEMAMAGVDTSLHHSWSLATNNLERFLSEIVKHSRVPKHADLADLAVGKF